MKTVHDLNLKWWYRLIKVLFVGSALLCGVIVIGIAFITEQPHQVSDYKVQCLAEYSNHATFFANKDANVYIFPYGNQTVYQALTDSDKQVIRAKCDISQDEVDATNARAIAYISEQEKLGVSHDAIQQYLDTNVRTFTITSTYRAEGSYGLVFLYSVLAVVVLLLVVEVIRRVFYYIMLGSVRPRKTAD